MCHQHLPGALVELEQSGKTASGPDGVLHYPPEACDGVEVVSTRGREEMEAQLIMVVVERGVELVRPVDPTAIDDHHDLLPGFAEPRHPLGNILAQLLGIKVRHDFIAHFGGAILDSADHAEQDAAGDTAPGAILGPRPAFAGFGRFDLALTQRACGQAPAPGFAPPAGPGERKAPQNGLVFVE
jgi:hypothetical protein